MNSKKKKSVVFQFKSIKKKCLEASGKTLLLRKVECIALTFSVDHLTPLGFELLSISENELPVCSVLIIYPMSIIAVVKVSPASNSR